jgi:DNA-3-methyladenine glycosylase I
MVTRCRWCGNDPLLIAYHDDEWGQPTTDDRLLFEYLTLEIFQSGLSWRTVLHKRVAFKAAFADFDIEKVAAYGAHEVAALLDDPGIIRNRRKIEATIKNAGICLGIIRDHGSFYNYLKALPAEPDEKKRVLSRTFAHVGPTVAESFLQAAGLIAVKHDPNCFLYQEADR